MYTMTVANALLIQLRLAGIESDDALVFFGSQVAHMLQSPANYGPHRNYFGTSFKYKTWILKGFYPGTPILFKVALIFDPDRTMNGHNYFAKVTLPPINVPKKIGTYSYVDGAKMTQHMALVAESQMLDIDRPAPLDLIKLNSPKCISPKGMPIFSLQKRK